MKTFGDKLREWRLKHGYSQEQLAASMQLSGLPCDRVRISKIEAGKIRMSVYELYVMVFAYGLHIEDLF